VGLCHHHGPWGGAFTGKPGLRSNDPRGIQFMVDQWDLNGILGGICPVEVIERWLFDG